MKKRNIFLIITIIVVLLVLGVKTILTRHHFNYYKDFTLMDKNGLTVYYFNNTEWEGQPVFANIEERVGFRSIDKEFFSLSYHGLLEIPVTGKYKFKLFSDDGSRFYLNGIPIIKNDGIHPPRKVSVCKFLVKGLYPIEIRYFQAGGGALLSLFWRPPKPFRDLSGPVPLDFIRPVGTGFNPHKVMELKEAIEKWDGIFRISLWVLFICILNLLWRLFFYKLILKFRNILAKIPYHLRYIFLLFIATRSALTIIGVCSRRLLDVFGRYQPDWVYSKSLWLDIWGLWDTGWYVKIADTGYPDSLNTEVARWGFFPLYSLLIRILNILIKDSYISGLIISNICLFITCIFLYKLVLLYNDDKTALRTIRYLFLFPSAFILSGVFSESLFLMLAVITFYFAKKEKWGWAGIAGFLFAFTRSNGVFIFLPILYEYLSSKVLSPSPIPLPIGERVRVRGISRLKGVRLDILFLLLIPLGIILFGLFCYYRTGNFFAYVYSKQTRFRMALGDPLRSLYLCLTSDNISLIFNAVLCIVGLLILVLSYKKLVFSYWLYGLLFIVIPLLYAMGHSEVRPVVGSMTGMARFMVVIFPFYILFGRLSEKEYIDRFLTSFFLLLQGFLMVFWSAGFDLVV